MKKLILAAGFALSASAALAQETPSAEGAEVYFVGLADGATVASPVTLHFGLKGMGVAPAGIEQENTGHHHLLINRPALGQGEDGADELIYSMPATENLRHFGGGQTEVTLDLPAGTHTLQLVLGDAAHVPHVPPVMSDVITIVVE
ncbi:DUF4399 domain-containing protein [Primorskyibacter sp. S187A]|uniref:DUF4399 domain-containing protein n=1 Tax=Primorskyibacter sp. S187A TaxID=3415130 RepID=UPI003C7CB12B